MTSGPPPPGGGYEVVVAGAGPAGAVAALVLARAGRRVLLADAVLSRPPPLGETLPAVAARLLGDLGLVGVLGEPHVPCYGSLSAWGTPALAVTDALYDPDGHGWRLDRPRFVAALRAAAHGAGADLVLGTAVRAPARDGRGWVADLAAAAGRRRVSCDVLVDATGRGAGLARRLGGRLRVRDRLLATVGTFVPGNCAGSGAGRGTGDGEPDRDGRTLVEAAPDGWWYTALLPAGGRTVAFLTDADLAPPPRSAAAFLDRLGATSHLRALLAAHRYTLLGGPERVPAHTARLDPPSGSGWIAVGDAALAVDPLSAQGLLTALHTGLLGGRALDAHLAGHSDAFDPHRDRLDAVAATFARNHREYYGQQTRWSDAAFWSRRSAIDQPAGWEYPARGSHA